MEPRSQARALVILCALLLPLGFVTAALADECTYPPCCNIESASVSCEHPPKPPDPDYAYIQWTVDLRWCDNPAPHIVIEYRCEGETLWTWVDQVDATQHAYGHQCPITCAARTPDYIEYKLTLWCPGCDWSSDSVEIRTDRDCCE